jgi:hypothetical protein
LNNTFSHSASWMRYSMSLIFLWRNPRDALDESFASKAVHSVRDSFVQWSETDTQIDQFLGGVLCPHHPVLFVLLDSNAKRRYQQVKTNAQPAKGLVVF